MTRLFDRFASVASTAVGHAWFFALCVLLVLVWVPSLPAFGSVDTWQLVINTATTILTFLMVALMQNAQNRSDRAQNAKLDALVRATPGASDELLRAEDRSEHEIEALRPDVG